MSRQLLKEGEVWRLFNLAAELEDTHGLSTQNFKKLEEMKVEWLRLREVMPGHK